MRKSIACLLILFLFKSAHPQAIKTDTGSMDGVRYKILFPENWKGKLVIYAHGYEYVGATPRQSQSPQFVASMKPFLDRGFAVAASDYSTQGYAIVEGVENSEALRQYFVKKYGQPDTTFITGHSMGGGITLATVEHFGKFYNGALPLCPLASRSYIQVRKEFDLYATFNGLFPGIVPTLADLFDLSKPMQPKLMSQMMLRVSTIRKEIIEKDSSLGVALAKHFDLKLNDLAFVLVFDSTVLRDIAVKAKGNPFDNMNTIYSGFPNDWDVNQKAERMAATVNPDVLFAKYDRTGNIEIPVMVLHTIYDQLIPPNYAVTNFENAVHLNGKDKYYTVKYTNGQGHCAFTLQQEGEAFDELRVWAKTGNKAKAGSIP